MKLISTLKLIYIAVLWLLSIYVLAIHMSSCCWEMTNLSYIRLINSQRWVARYSGVWNHCQLLLLIIINENVVHLRSKNITHVQSHAWKMQGNFIGPRVVEDLNHLRCNRPKWSGPCDTQRWISSTTQSNFDFHPGNVVHNQDTKGKPVANLTSSIQVKTETGISNQLGAPCKMVSRLKYCTRRFSNLQELHDLIHSRGQTSAHQCTI